jgi:hypothetical protein
MQGPRTGQTTKPNTTQLPTMKPTTLLMQASGIGSAHDANTTNSYWPSRVSLHRFSLFSFCKFLFYFSKLYYFTTSKVLPQGCVDPLIAVDVRTAYSQSPDYSRCTDCLLSGSHRMLKPLRCTVGAHCSPINNLSIDYHQYCSSIKSERV